jgi:hypothetical protein
MNGFEQSLEVNVSRVWMIDRSDVGDYSRRGNLFFEPTRSGSEFDRVRDMSGINNEKKRVHASKVRRNLLISADSGLLSNEGSAART